MCEALSHHHRAPSACVPAPLITSCNISDRMSGSGFLAGFMFGNVNSEGELEDDILDKV